MADLVDNFFQEDPSKWIEELPSFQRTPLKELLLKGLSYDDVAEEWIGSSAATTAPFSAGQAPHVNKKAFLSNLKLELRYFLCGDKKYKKERDGLFGQHGIARTYVISGIAVVIAPHLGVAAPVICPVIALVLASFGKLTLNAWCTTQQRADEKA